jgi:WD40 repeat protein/serine/threonine protein kinase
MDQTAAADPLLALIQEGAAEGEETLVSSAQRRSAVRALRRGHAARAGSQRTDPTTASVILPVPKQVGEYEILAEVGRGGMGVVYKARHRGLHRLAALKMVLAGEFASPAQEVRFRLEAELAARVQHPNIVQVYEIGSYQGRPFLAMEWVEGGSLANRLDGKPWPPGAAASLVETLARAIHVAHSAGIVHRDLKPANILLLEAERAKPTVEESSARSESTPQPSSLFPHPSSLTPHPSPFIPHPSSLTPHPSPLILPKITDFGLARPTVGGITLTQSGLLVGTPGYMAPEQAGGTRGALVGPATDIYALGVVLYQLLTGRLPFPGDSTLEVLRAVTSDEPVRPRRLQPRLPRDLEAITLHCLEKASNRRYQNALALADDLQRFRDGKPVVARPVGSAARLARACRRRPLVALLFGLLTASLFGGLAGVTWKWLEANEQRDLANAHARRVDAESREALSQAYRARLAAAVASLQNHDVADAARQLDAAPKELRGWEWRHLHSRLDDSSSMIRLPPGEAGVLLPTADRLRIGILTASGLSLTDLEGGEPRTVPFPNPGARNIATQTRIGLRVAAWVDSRTFHLLGEAGRRICRVDVPWDGGPREVIVSQDGTQLVSPNMIDGWSGFGVFDAASGKLKAISKGPKGDAWSLALSPDGSRVATGAEDRTPRVWDAATGTLLATCEGHTSKVLGVSFSPDGTRLLSTSADGTVRQWAVATGREVEPPYDRHSSDVTAAVYSPDGRLVASAGTDRTVRVWQASGRQDVAVLHGHTGTVMGVAFAPGGRRLASVSYPTRISMSTDQTVRGWDVDPQATLPVLRKHKSYVYPVAYSPDGRWIASGSWDSDLRLWDAATGQPYPPLPHSGVVEGLAYSADGTFLASGSYADSRLRIWDAATARVRKEIPLPVGVFRSVTIRPDGMRLAVTTHVPRSQKYYAHVCDFESGQWIFSAEGRSITYSPDGRWLAVRAADAKTVLVLDAETHETVHRFRGHEQFVYSAAFSPDSSRIASCSMDRTVRVWQIKSGACQVLRGHTDEVFAVAFHPDGTRLATAGRDPAVWLWDLKRGEEVARLPGHASYVWSLAFSPDGTTLASGSGDFTVRLWDTAPLRVRYQARREAAALRPEAESLVERLWREKNGPTEVVEALRTDRALSEPLRQAALREVLRRALLGADPADTPGLP